MEDDRVKHHSNMLRQVHGAEILKNNVLNQGVIISEESVGVGGHNFVGLGANEPVLNTGNSVTISIQIREEFRSNEELDAR